MFHRPDLYRVVLPAFTWIAAAVLMFGWGINSAQSGILPDRIGLFARLMNSPLVLILPVAAVVFGALPTVAATANRYFSLLWNRTDPGRAIGRMLLRTAWATFAAFFALAMLAYAFATLLWPVLQPELINPAAYGLEAGTIREVRAGQFNFGPAMLTSDWPLGLLLTTLFAVQSAAYATLAQAVLLLSNRSFLALSTPLIVHIGQSTLVALAGTPGYALMYVSAPFGVIRTGEFQPLITLALLVAAAAVLGRIAIARRHRLSSLT